MAIADHITVLRDGQSVFSAPAQETTQALLVHKMVGRELGELFPPLPAPDDHREPLLDIRDLTVSESSEGPPRLREISFRLEAGEIVGIYGLLGAGRSELLLHLFGAWGTRRRARCRCSEQTMRRRARRTRLRPAGLLMVSEDRRRFGLVMDELIRFNLTLSSLSAVIERGLINRRTEQRVTQQMATRLHIKAAGLAQPVRTLSGGNQQKVVLGKALLCRPKVVLLDEPTRGVDVGAKQEIYGLLDELRREGLGVDGVFGFARAARDERPGAGAG